MKNKILKQNKGITLIALVITIIVLLILAGVAISMLSGENGILTKAGNAKTRTDEESTMEQIKLAATAAIMNPDHKVDETMLKQELARYGYGQVSENEEDGYTVTVGDDTYTIDSNGNVSKSSNSPAEVTITSLIESGKPVDTNTPAKDDYGNTIIVPAGFKITADADTVPEGIVIEDVTAGNVTDETTGETTNPTLGSQFVWIPVGDVYITTDEVKTDTNTKTITLGRYSWSGSAGTPVQTVTTEAEAETEAMKAKTETIAANDSYYEVTKNNEKYGSNTNAKAKSLEDFLKSSVKNGGYYIGRYEAGDAIATSNGEARSSASETTGTLVCKANQQVYNYIKQTDASKISQEMYISDYFESDLINSYAWDTAIVFIQTMPNGNSTYASMPGKSAINTSSPQTTGTDTLSQTSKIDVQCNIYDMAGNVSECSTETSSFSNSPCVYRGGSGSSSYCTRTRSSGSSNAYLYGGFRPLLYVGLNSDSD